LSGSEIKLSFTCVDFKKASQARPVAEK